MCVCIVCRIRKSPKASHANWWATAERSEPSRQGTSPAAVAPVMAWGQAPAAPVGHGGPAAALSGFLSSGTTSLFLSGVGPSGGGKATSGADGGNADAADGRSANYTAAAVASIAHGDRPGESTITATFGSAPSYRDSTEDCP